MFYALFGTGCRVRRGPRTRCWPSSSSLLPSSLPSRCACRIPPATAPPATASGGRGTAPTSAASSQQPHRASCCGHCCCHWTLLLPCTCESVLESIDSSPARTRLLLLCCRAAALLCCSAAAVLPCCSAAVLLLCSAVLDCCFAAARLLLLLLLLLLVLGTRTAGMPRCHVTCALLAHGPACGVWPDDTRNPCGPCSIDTRHEARGVATDEAPHTQLGRCCWCN